MKKVSNLIAVLVTMCIMLTGCGEQINKGVEQINKGVDSSPSAITSDLTCSEEKFYESEGITKSEEKEAYNKYSESEVVYYLIKYDKLSDIIDILDNFDNSEIMSLTKKQDFMEIGIIFDTKSDEDRFLKEVTSNLSENKRFKGIEKIEKH